MEKKEVKEERQCCEWTRRGLWLIAVIILGAFGFACLIQSIALHLALGFKFGFFGYMLAFALFAAAKACKRRVCRC